MLWLKCCLQLLLLYLYLRSLPPARTATLLTMSCPSTDSIWSDLRKRTGTITLFSFFRWVPSERRKEGRGEEVNKPSAFLQKNKETLDRHLHFSMKQGSAELLKERVSQDLMLHRKTMQFECLPAVKWHAADELSLPQRNTAKTQRNAH